MKTKKVLGSGAGVYSEGDVTLTPYLLVHQGSPESDVVDKKGRDAKRDKDNDKDKDGDKARGKSHSDGKHKSPKGKAAKEEVGIFTFLLHLPAICSERGGKMRRNIQHTFFNVFLFEAAAILTFTNCDVCNSTSATIE